MSNSFRGKKTGWFGRYREVQANCSVSICAYISDSIKYLIVKYYGSIISDYSMLLFTDIVSLLPVFDLEVVLFVKLVVKWAFSKHWEVEDVDINKILKQYLGHWHTLNFHFPLLCVCCILGISGELRIQPRIKQATISCSSEKSAIRPRSVWVPSVHSVCPHLPLLPFLLLYQDFSLKSRENKILVVYHRMRKSDKDNKGYPRITVAYVMDDRHPVPFHCFGMRSSKSVRLLFNSWWHLLTHFTLLFLHSGERERKGEGLILSS